MKICGVPPSSAAPYLVELDREDELLSGVLVGLLLPGLLDLALLVELEARVFVIEIILVIANRRADQPQPLVLVVALDLVVVRFYRNSRV